MPIQGLLTLGHLALGALTHLPSKWYFSCLKLAMFTNCHYIGYLHISLRLLLVSTFTNHPKSQTWREQSPMQMLSESICRSTWAYQVLRSGSSAIVKLRGLRSWKKSRLSHLTTKLKKKIPFWSIMPDMEARQIHQRAGRLEALVKSSFWFPTTTPLHWKMETPSTESQTVPLELCFRTLQARREII